MGQVKLGFFPVRGGGLYNVAGNILAHVCVRQHPTPSLKWGPAQQECPRRSYRIAQAPEN